MKCPYCGRRDLRQEHRIMANPAKDIFYCLDCDRKFYRYQDTELEQVGDTRIEEYTNLR